MREAGGGQIGGGEGGGGGEVWRWRRERRRRGGPRWRRMLGMEDDRRRWMEGRSKAERTAAEGRLAGGGGEARLRREQEEY